MLRSLLTPVALAGPVLASCLMSGCVIVVDADTDVDCLSEHDEDGKLRLGISMDHVDAALAGQLNITADRATLVTSVYPGWPADRAGMRQFDVITKVDGSDDASPSAVQSAIRAKQPGEAVTLTVIRNAQPIDVTVTIEAHPDDHEGH